MRIRRLTVVALAAALAIAAGCADLLGLGSFTGRTDAAPGDVEAPEAGDAAPDPCARVVAPPRPAQDDPSDADITVINVIHTFDLGERFDGSAPPLIGFDLDGVNTCCDQAPESCVTSVKSTHCDSDGGRDNSGGQLIQLIAQYGVADLDQRNINDTIDAGLSSLIMIISGYNGTANDTQVSLSMFSSTGIVRTADGGHPPANWDGNDTWFVDKSSALGVTDAGLPIPIQFDTNAYVSNGVLVAFVGFPIIFGTGGSSLALLSDSVVVAPLVAQGGSFRIDDGQGAGRLSTTHLFTLLHQFPNPFGPGFLCPGTLAYDNAKPVICELADITSSKALDNTGAKCDALSFGVAFSTFPAKVGPIDQDDGGKTVSTCADAAPDFCP